MGENQVATSIGQMVITYGHFLLLGVIVIIGATVFTIKKIGIFNTNTKRSSKCDEIDGFCEPVKKIHTKQVEIETKQTENIKKLDLGAQEFKEIHSKINDITVAVYVLLERSDGGIPDFLKKQDKMPDLVKSVLKSE